MERNSVISVWKIGQMNWWVEELTEGWTIRGQSKALQSGADLSWKKFAKVSRWTINTGCSIHSSHVTSCFSLSSLPSRPSISADPPLLLSWSFFECSSLRFSPIFMEGTVITAPVVQSAFHPGIEAGTHSAGSTLQSALTNPKGNLSIKVSNLNTY